GAISGVDAARFGRGRGGAAVNLSREDFRQASLVRGQLPITPGRESLRVTDREARVTRASTADSGRFFSHRQPTQVDRVPFEQQRQTIERTSRGTFGDPAGRSAQVDNGASR